MKSLSDETGSIAPLALGLATLLLAMTFTFVNSGSLLLFQERQTQQAEGLALAVAETASPAELALAKTDPTRLGAAGQEYAGEAGILFFDVQTTDGFTVTAKVCGDFATPITVPLVPAPTSQRVCATAKARKI